ncbi:MAG: Rpp14/Pop5 family protein [Candidatus Micrarchaeia archaeon]
MECSTKLNENIMDYFYSNLHTFIGSKEYANANPKIVKTYLDNMFLIQVNRGSEKNVILGAAFIKDPNLKIGFYTIKTSGTINSISDFIRKSYQKDKA